jgi:hypothetical protein
MGPAQPAVAKNIPTRPATRVVETEGLTEPKNAHERRVKPIAGLRKISELAAAAVQACLKEEARHASDLDRVRGLCNLVFSGAFSTMLKNSTLLTDEDKEFLHQLGFL